MKIAAVGPNRARPVWEGHAIRASRLQLAPLEAPLDAQKEPRPSRIQPLPDAAGPFSLARGPAVRRGLAYWVSRGRLLGQTLASAGTGTPLVLG